MNNSANDEKRIITWKNALVVGLGRSGTAAAEALKSMGVDVVVYDKQRDEEKEKWARDNGFGADFGDAPADAERYDAIVLSPGVPPDQEFIIKARESGAEITGELELAYRCGKGTYIAITGTNGKTTTTTLVGEIFRRAGKDTRVVGNIGVAVISKAMEASDDTYLVTECSSFQLETAFTFRPRVSAILNITPDHLNRHKTMENYILAKSNIFANQRENDYMVYNVDDPLVGDAAKNCLAVKVPFSRKKELAFGVFVKDGRIVVRQTDGVTDICGTDEILIPGLHNLENALAATAIAYFAGIDAAHIAAELREFAGVSHRMEKCAVINGIQFVNDSKGTNPDAAIKAVISYENIILIAGGYDKGSEYGEFISNFENHVKELVLMGETAPKIREAALAAGFDHIHMVSNMKEAVRKSFELAVPGDTILLSPACASWDMYKKFEDRGDDFKRCAAMLKDD